MTVTPESVMMYNVYLSRIENTDISTCLVPPSHAQIPRARLPNQPPGKTTGGGEGGVSPGSGSGCIRTPPGGGGGTCPEMSVMLWLHNRDLCNKLLLSEVIMTFPVKQRQSSLDPV